MLCEDSGAVSIWASNDDVWKTWSELITVAEHDDAALAVDCLDSGKEYVTVGADGNIKVCLFLIYKTYTYNTYTPSQQGPIAVIKNKVVLEMCNKNNCA